LRLQTPRVVLREPEPGDLSFLVALRTDPDVRRYLGGALADDAAAALAQLNLSRPDGFFVVERRDEGVPVGVVLLHEGHGGTEVSYQFAPDSWGRGFAAEAVGCVVDHAFAAEGIDELLAVTQVANGRSRRLLDRLGFTPVDEFEEFDEPQVRYTRKRNVSVARRR